MAHYERYLGVEILVLLANSDQLLRLTFESFKHEVYFRVMNMLIWFKTFIMCPELHAGFGENCEFGEISSCFCERSIVKAKGKW